MGGKQTKDERVKPLNIKPIDTDKTTNAGHVGTSLLHGRKNKDVDSDGWERKLPNIFGDNKAKLDNREPDGLVQVGLPTIEQIQRKRTLSDDSQQKLPIQMLVLNNQSEEYDNQDNVTNQSFSANEMQRGVFESDDDVHKNKPKKKTNKSKKKKHESKRKNSNICPRKPDAWTNENDDLSDDRKDPITTTSTNTTEKICDLDDDMCQANDKRKIDRIESIKMKNNFTLKVMTLKMERLVNFCKDEDVISDIDEDKANVCPQDFLKGVRSLEKHIISERKKVKLLTKQNDEYINRLSGFAGAMLTNNNPNITDLNDPNRPTKLAEQYNKIYDDEWTDAMDMLEQIVPNSEEDYKEKCVYHLYSVLKIVYTTCKKKADTQLRRLAEEIFFLKNPSTEQIDGTWQNYNNERNKLIEMRKRTAESVILLLLSSMKEDELFVEEISASNPPLDIEIFSTLLTHKYFKKCVHICWQFVIQDPPMYLDTQSLVGTTLNKDTHKEYRTSGTIIKYVVWPTLYLHHLDGTQAPILAKGVVQPEKSDIISEK